jgi:hypothetical protein
MSLQSTPMNITNIIEFINYLNNDKNINSINDNNLLILYQLIYNIENELLLSHFDQINLVKRLNDIKKSSSYKETEKNKEKEVIKKELVKNDENLKADHIDLSSIKVDKHKISTSFSKIVQGFKGMTEEETIFKSDTEKAIKESIKSNTNENKNIQLKINLKNKEEFCKIVNDYTKHIIEVCEESIKNSVDRSGNENPFREITTEVMRFGIKLHDNYPGIFTNGYTAFSQFHYGPLNPKKEGVEQNYNERNLTIYKNFDEELGFIKAQKYILEKGYKLLDISDPHYRTRDFYGNKSNNNKSDITSNRIKIILTNKSYIIRQEDIELWHNLNKLPKINLEVDNNAVVNTSPEIKISEIKTKDKKINKLFKKNSSKEEKNIPSAEEAFENTIIEEDKDVKNSANLQSEDKNQKLKKDDEFSLIDDN